VGLLTREALSALRLSADGPTPRGIFPSPAASCSWCVNFSSCYSREVEILINISSSSITH